MKIKDKVAVLTGAGSGIASAVAMQLAERGIKAIAMVDRGEVVKEVAEEVNLKAGRSIAFPFIGDVVDEDFRREVYDKISSEHGLVSICVPAAGITRDGLAVRVNKETGKASIYPVDTYRLVVDVDLIAPVYWSLEMVARIAEDRFANGLRRWHPDEDIQGVIVFIGSAAAQGNKGQVAYAAAKAGLEGAAATMMKETIFHGVRCSVLHPGFTDTPLMRLLDDDFVEKHVLPATQLGRLIKPEEIADAICFLITNHAVSGELWADAGWHPSAV